ncbi:hypothetical protein EYF80_011561 [Liparis tanakae]|uniref:Uncharacterized protein n=1 Tax=Liparis tanakae TaxID=230148 RepID=A0A4Z2IKL9_9TELE|nr:hypothetical protein EYF80_011561 [Liparis tanakae]
MSTGLRGHSVSCLERAVVTAILKPKNYYWDEEYAGESEGDTAKEKTRAREKAKDDEKKTT